MRPHNQPRVYDQTNVAAAARSRIRIAKRVGAVRVYDRNWRADARERTGGEGKIGRRNSILVSAGEIVRGERRRIHH